MHACASTTKNAHVYRLETDFVLGFVLIKQKRTYGVREGSCRARRGSGGPLVAVVAGGALGAGRVGLGGAPWAVEACVALPLGGGQPALGAVGPPVAVQRVAGAAGAVGAWPALSACTAHTHTQCVRTRSHSQCSLLSFFSFFNTLLPLSGNSGRLT